MTDEEFMKLSRAKARYEIYKVLREINKPNRFLSFLRNGSKKN